jgi:hypothetical protein
MMEEREEEEAHGTAEKPMIMDELKGERVEKSYCFSFLFVFCVGASEENANVHVSNLVNHFEIGKRTTLGNDKSPGTRRCTSPRLLHVQQAAAACYTIFTVCQKNLIDVISKLSLSYF